MGCLRDNKIIFSQYRQAYPVKMTEDTTLAEPSVRQTKRKTQARSLERRRAIMNAARELLDTTAIGDLSLYQVADKAGIPPSSLYHFFPKVEVLLDALVEEIFIEFDVILEQQLDYKTIDHWSDIIRQLQARYIAFYRERKYVRDLILGQHVASTIRHADYLHDEELGCKICRYHERLYQLPPLPEEYNIFAIALQIADKVYSISHQEFGNITDTLAQEGVNAALAYLGQYLPQQLQKRVA